ncbi:MAG: RES family NAD+ phosphorylase [Proteobacteria bacterium]|nr:RES family NAD+ phosphorylase [Pseudomonadota bacterium]
MILWRISNYADLSGAGGLAHHGRWHNRGRPVIYLAESAAAALLEVLVHVEAAHPGELPAQYQLLEIAVPDGVSITNVALPDGAPLAEGWQADLITTRRCGDAWLAKGASLLLRVPSAVVGRTHNLLLNPLHPEITGCRIVSAARYPFDERLLAKPASGAPPAA